MLSKTLLCVTGIGDSDEDLNAAAAICEEIEAHLSVLVVKLTALPPLAASEMFIPEDWSGTHAGGAWELRRRVEHVKALLRNKSLRADVSPEYGEIHQAGRLIGTRARYADLAVLGPELLRDGDLKLQAVIGILFESGRPLLLLPSSNSAALRPRTIVVAWNSSLQAARAVAWGMEIMAGAEDVHVVMVDPVSRSGRADAEPGGDIGAYLARHGIKVTVDRIPSVGKTVTEALAQRADDLAADLLVMGAYGRSRLGERIFGGVTNDLVDRPPIPVFMVH